MNHLMELDPLIETKSQHPHEGLQLFFVLGFSATRESSVIG